MNEKIVNLSRLLNECLTDGESVSNHDQEVIILFLFSLNTVYKDPLALLFFVKIVI